MASAIELPPFGTASSIGNGHVIDVDEDDGGEAEIAGLISRSRLGVAPQHALHRRRSSHDGEHEHGTARSVLQLLASFVFFASVIMYALGSISGGDSGGDAPNDNYHPPAGHDPSKSADPAHHSSVSTAGGTSKAKPHLVAGDVSTFQCKSENISDSFDLPRLAQLKKGELEGWGISYNKLKKMLRPWKEEVFIPNIQSGDRIFESACGAGVNLMISAEILQESSSSALADIWVYGNDYRPDAVGEANQIWSSKETAKLANRGSFCQGDSSRLADFVPASSFDLAYSGYFVPVIPNFPNSNTEEDSWRYSVSLCNSTDPNDIRLRNREQRTQEDWISAWVKGLLHIVKPGKVVALENVAYPLCSAEGGRDWGGVSKEWWAGAFGKYGWEADPSSLVIRDEVNIKGWVENRYHVMMQKKGATSKPTQGESSSETVQVCPTNVDKSDNDVAADEFDLYVEDSNAHKGKTLKEFRTMKLDGWGISFDEVKEMLRPWKEQVFVPNIRSGDTIYESACGIGMNLLLSAEILSEHDITGLTVSGNDYVAESVDIANVIWGDDEEAKQLAHKGFFCRADSSRLDYIPDNSFDFAYSGYIDPIVDPLQLWPNITVDDQWGKGVELCKTHKKKAKKAQEIQNEWYASWTLHLIRIAKPGKVIAIENGAESLCSNSADWGGVDKTWWKEAIREYKWDVDPDSLYIEDEVPTKNWKDTRYHVMMRKNRLIET